MSISYYTYKPPGIENSFKDICRLDVRKCAERVTKTEQLWQSDDWVDPLPFHNTKNFVYYYVESFFESVEFRISLNGFTGQ